MGTILKKPSIQIAHHPTGKPVNLAQAGQVHQLDFAGLARFEAHGGAGRNVQAHAPAGGAVEGQCVVGFEKVEMRAHLNRPVAAVGDGQAEGAASGVEFDVAGLDLVLTRDHVGCPKVLK